MLIEVNRSLEDLYFRCKFRYEENILWKEKALLCGVETNIPLKWILKSKKIKVCRLGDTRINAISITPHLKVKLPELGQSGGLTNPIDLSSRDEFHSSLPPSEP